MSLCLCLVAQMPIAQSVLFIAICALSACLSSAGGLALNLLRPNLNWTSEGVPIKQSMPVFIALFGFWALAAAIIVPYIFLGKVLRPNVNIGTAVQQHQGAVLSGHDGCKGRSLHASDPSDDPLSSDKYGTGIACGNACVRLSLFYHLERNHQRRILLPADRLNGMVRSPDHLFCVLHGDRTLRIGLAIQTCSNLLLASDQDGR